MSFGVEYIIGLIDKFTPVAERVAKSAMDADKGIGALGKAATTVDGQMRKLAEGMTAVGRGATSIVQGTNEAAAALGKLGGAANKSADEQIAAFRRAAQARQDSKFSNNPRFFNADGSPRNTGPSWGGGGRGGRGEEGGRGGGGLGFIGGLWALSGLHNDVLKTWLDFDDQMRKVRGTMADRLSDEDFQALRQSAMDVSKGTRFSPEDIAKVLLSEASQGVPLTQKTADGRLLGGVIAKQMLGIATGTGEDPAETFSTHLKIMRGFKLGFESFPHISDTIALLHAQTGVSMKQIQTQMGNVAAAAGASGWTEEQTAGALGVLTKHGVGPLSGVGMRRIIEQSTKTWSKQQQEGWKSLGITQDMLRDPKTGGVITPVNLAKLLEDHSKGMSAFDIEAAMAKIFGSKAATVGTQLLGSSKELQELTYMLEHVEGLAEKMGEFGAKGGAAGVAQMGAAWERLKTSIGETGFGDTIGNLARWFGDLFDSIGKGPDWAKETVGGLAAAMNLLADAALPLMAMHALWPMLKGAFSGLGKITGLANLTSAAGAAERLAAAYGVLNRLTAAGLALGIAAVVINNWKEISGYIERVAAAWAKIKSGDILGGLKDGGKALWDANKAAGNAAKAPWAPIDTTQSGILDRWVESLMKADPSKSPMAHRGFGTGALATPAEKAIAAGAQRVQADVTVRSTIDPIQILPTTANVNVKVDVDAKGVGTGTGTGAMPLSANAPRGQTAASPANPQVAK